MRDPTSTSSPAVSHVLVEVVLALAMAGCAASPNPTLQRAPQLTLLEQDPSPVLTVNSLGAAGVTYGIEGGQVIKIGTTYHLITAEFIQNPLDPSARFTKTNIAHWISTDHTNWQRASTLLASSGDRTGTDPRAVYAGPLPIYDARMQRWELFYVGYRSQPDSAPYPPNATVSDPNPFLFPVDANFTRNVHDYYEYSGRIFRAASLTSGVSGIDGPYQEIQAVLTTNLGAQPWEGLFGDDSFEPYRVGNYWFAFYGSAHTEGTSNSPFSARLMVGLVSAPTLDGPWTREPGNPLSVEPIAWENPIVYRCRNGSLIALYNAPGWPTFDIGYTTSADGFHWSPGKTLALQPSSSGNWIATLRTPLGLVLEPDGTYTIFYTAATTLDAWSDSYHMAMSYVRVKLQD